MKYVKDQMVKKGDPLGFSGRDKSKWAKGLGLQAGGERVLFVGCIFPVIDKIEGIYDVMRKLGPRRAVRLALVLEAFRIKGVFLKLFTSGDEKPDDRLRKIASALTKLGVEFGYLGDEEPCCGEILYNLGYHELFRRHAEKVKRLLKSKGVRELIVLAPFCAYAFKTLYPKIMTDWNVKVKTLVEVILEYLREKRMTSSAGESIVYHDPCYYSRFLDIYREPREIFSRVKGVRVLEPKNRGPDTRCVGDGGLELIDPEMAEEVAVERVKELLATGASIIVTQCPACIMMLRRGLKKLDREDVRVEDIGEFIYRVMRGA